MSGRERDRDRGERSSRAQQQAAARTNEYFVPKDGIDREVITADICRYLGNDALVRPGTYENAQTRLAQQGYFITAYRNLTTAMIADLKADSERWEQERRQTASRGQPQNVEYRSSTTHQSRQYYGPTETAPPDQGHPAAGGYQTPAASQQGVYDNPQYQSNPPYAGQPQGYGSTPQTYLSQDGYYVAGANLEPEQPRDRVASQQGAIPRTNTVPYSSTPTYQQPDTRYNNYPPAGAGPSPVSSALGYSQQPTDPFYGRAGNGYEPAASEVYDARYADPRAQAYPDTSAYSSAQAPPSSATANSGAPRRERDREEGRESSGRHHGRRR